MRVYGHYARVLVDLYLNGSFYDDIIVEREDFTFFVGIEYERVPSFCTECQVIGHMLNECKRRKKELDDSKCPRYKPASAPKKGIVGNQTGDPEKEMEVPKSPLQPEVEKEPLREEPERNADPEPEIYSSRGWKQ